MDCTVVCTDTKYQIQHTNQVFEKSRRSIHTANSLSNFQFITEIYPRDLHEPDDKKNGDNPEDDGQYTESSHVDDYYCDLSDDEVESDISQVCYSAACKAMGVTPAKHIINSLRSEAIVMRNHVLGYRGARACAIALVRNTDVERLHLERNEIGGRGAGSFAQVLSCNNYITDLTLAKNCLGSLGAEVICEVLCKNRTVKKLNLSGNGFKERDGIHFQNVLEDILSVINNLKFIDMKFVSLKPDPSFVFLSFVAKNRTLRELNVSHNEFREVGGEALAEGLCKNDTLQKLDLSWNHLRLKGAVAIGQCLEGNVGLKHLNLSWNGFHDDGCKALGESLSHNRSLTHLDLTCNRIFEFCLPPLVEALDKNDTLQVLRLGSNSVGMDGAMSILYAIDASEVTKISDLDLGIQSVYSTFVDVEMQIAAKRPFRATYGVVLTPAPSYDGLEENDSKLFDGDNPMVVLMEFMRLQNLRLIDLFSSLDKDGDQIVTHDEIKFRLEETNVPLSEEGINRLIRNLDTDSSGTIDFGELFSGQKEHKRNVQKQLMSAGEVPWEKTPIGKVSVKMQQVMDKRVIMRKKERMAAEKYQREAEERKERLRNRQQNVNRSQPQADVTTAKIEN